MNSNFSPLIQQYKARNKSIYNIAMLCLMAVILIAGSFACNSNERPPSSAALKNSDIQKVKLFDLDDTPVELSKYQHKIVFINFWATWCKPCLEEMPSIAKAQELLARENVIFLLASDETPEQIGQFKNDHHFNFNYVRIDNASELNIVGLPTTFIYNSEGKLIFSEMGFRKWDEKKNLDLILNTKKLQ